jgi:hypothetical protein
VPGILGGIGITIVLLGLALGAGVAGWKAGFHKLVPIMGAALVCIVIAGFAVNVNARTTLAAWMVNQIVS